MKAYTIKNHVMVTVQFEIEAESVEQAKQIARNQEITNQDVIDAVDEFMGIDEMWTITDEDGNEETTI